MNRRAILVTLVLLLAAPLLAEGAGDGVRLEVRKVLLSGTPIPHPEDGQLMINQDVTRFVWAARDLGRKDCRPVVDKLVSAKSYPGFAKLGFSPDGRRAAYVVGEGPEPGRTRIFVDGIAVEMLYDRVPTGEELEGKIHPAQRFHEYWRFSPDSRHFLFVAEDKEGFSVVYDGVRQKLYQNVYFPTFSPDSGHWSYTALEKGGFFKVIDGKEQKRYESVFKGGMVYSADSKRWAYRAGAGNKQFVVIDGTEYGPYDNATDAVFSPDSQHAAFGAYSGGQARYILDGKEFGGGFDGVAEPVFRSDNRLACIGFSRKIGSRLIVDGVPGESTWESYIAGSLLASPTGARTAFIEDLSHDPPPAAQLRYVIDGVGQKVFDRVSPDILFSPDGRRFAYRAMHEKAWAMIVDGQIYPAGRMAAPPVFSSDSKHVAYGATNLEGRGIVVRDGEVLGPFELQSPKYAWSPDGTHLAYAVKENGRMELVVDGVASPVDVAHFAGPIHFTAPDRFVIGATTEAGEVFRLEARIVPVAGGLAASAPATNAPPATRATSRPEDKQAAAWLNMARNFLEAGRLDNARSYATRVMETYPNTPWSRQAQEILKAISEKSE
ncbi:MAG: tetratricopeptide repeat protein [Planctomycetota bacterium]|nr:tetratricopeptide repeat protein [Planctomycetota bacterium]